MRSLDNLTLNNVRWLILIFVSIVCFVSISDDTSSLLGLVSTLKQQKIKNNFVGKITLNIKKKLKPKIFIHITFAQHYTVHFPSFINYSLGKCTMPIPRVNDRAGNEGGSF